MTLRVAPHTGACLTAPLGVVRAARATPGCTELVLPTAVFMLLQVSVAR